MTPQALAALRASAERGMTEDAEPGHAAAREQLLQHFRDTWHESSHLERGDFEWVVRLAAAGHLPAAWLLAKLLKSPAFEDYPLAADRIAELSPYVPGIAQYLAWRELRKLAPDFARAREWLEHGGVHGLLGALRELTAIAGGPSDSDFACIQIRLPFKRAVFFDYHAFDTKELLCAFAEDRLLSADEEQKRIGWALLERAAVLGSRVAGGAVEVLFKQGYDAAADKAAFMEQWFAAGKPMPDSAAGSCLKLGAALENGGRFDQAMVWYERAVRGMSYNTRDRGHGDFGYALAHAFDRRSSTHLVDDAELAMKWHARAADTGDERCLDTWLLTCVRGEMGLAPDPAAALERVRRFRASGVDMASRRWRLAGAIKAMSAAAAADAGWSEVVALLEK